MVDYRKERIVILGLGLTGLSCVNFFLDRGVVPKVMDIQRYPQYLKQLPKNIKCCFGKLNRQWLLDSTLIVVSPGVPLSDPILVQALNSGIEIVGDIELFVRETDKPIIAITGSNGKSTVTQLLSQIAICSGLAVGVGGNIGVPALMLLKKFCQLYILEISSFQLETTHNLHSVASTVLNISCDHMNRYKFGLSQYRTTKLKIYNNAQVCLINVSDPLTFPIISISGRNSGYCVSFGYELGDYRLSWQAGRYCLMAYNTFLLYCSEMKISGYHNYMNALAAIALADIVLIPRKYSLFVLRNFSGLSHCLELVHENNDIRWINDSKSTNVNSTIAAIRSLLPSKGMIHLLLGGDGKCVDFSPLGYWIQNDKMSVYCFGKDAKHLGSLRSYDVVITENMKQAIRIISTRVRKYDIVLLSPACSSLDQFRNFRVRGCIFSQLARKIR